MVTMDNYEEYMLLYADDELDVAGTAQLMAFVKQHPELQKELDAYAGTKLTPNMELQYSDKRSLLKTEPAATKTIALGNWWKYTAAAAAILLVCLLVWKLRTTETPEAEIVKAPQPATMPAAPATPQPAPVPQPQLQQPVQPQRAVAQRKAKTPPAKLVTENNTQNTQVAHTPKPKQQPVNQPVQQDPASQENTLHTVDPTPIPEQNTIAHNSSATENRKSSLLQSLPITQERKQGINQLASAVNDKITRVREAGESIKNTDVSVKLGKRELFTIHF